MELHRIHTSKEKGDLVEMSNSQHPRTILNEYALPVRVKPHLDELMQSLSEEGLSPKDSGQIVDSSHDAYISYFNRKGEFVGLAARVGQPTQEAESRPWGFYLRL